MLTVMTWNVENLFRPASNADPAEAARYAHKLRQLAATIASTTPDLVGLQEIGDAGAFDDFLAAVGPGWTGCLSQHHDGRGIRVGWIARGRLSDPTDVTAFPAKVPPVRVDDDGREITSTRRGALAVTYTRDDGVSVQALTAHFKSKLITFPGSDPDRPRFDTRDEGERARYAMYALAQRAADAVTARDWATRVLANDGQHRHVLVCGDVNDTPLAATTQLLLGPPGSQLGTGGFSQADRGDGNRLWNLAPRMPADDPATPGDEAANWSRKTNGVRELIDQVFVSHALVHRLQLTAALPVEGLPSVTADPASLRETTAPSDHRPVIARFDL